MKKCVFILPFFGELKSYFSMFIESFKNNDKFDLLLVTDNEISSQKNVKVVNMSFDDCISLFQSKFDFKISLKNPYKLCDFKPAFGYIFSEYINGYEYWGHCDSDLIFGDLNNLLYPLFEKGYDKIFTPGHLTIYKNTFENNTLFMKLKFNNELCYKRAYTSDDIFVFDEDLYAINVHSVFLDNNRNIFVNDLSFNVSTRYYRIVRSTYFPESRTWNDIYKRKYQLYWSNGKVYGIYLSHGKLITEEFLYFHIQKRPMKNIIDISGGDKTIMLLPEAFKLVDNVPSSVKEYKKQNHIYINKNAINRYIFRLKSKRWQKLSPYRLRNPYH